MSRLIFILIAVALTGCSSMSSPTYAISATPWLLVDDFERKALSKWTNVDTQNDTAPFVANPQITDIRSEGANQFLIKKPAKDGLVGNRKALSIIALPQTVWVGEVSTFFTQIAVERFPNNHAFGLSNLNVEDILKHDYNAFEPTLRVTDKYESNGFKNDGTLMVKIDSDDKYRQYDKIQNYDSNTPAEPLKTAYWYNIWFVVNNKALIEDGQTFDVYMLGGEFTEQTLVFKNARFRMKRELPLTHFFATCNTGPMNKPYGNGGLAYDNIYMSKGINLSTPVEIK